MEHHKSFLSIGSNLNDRTNLNTTIYLLNSNPYSDSNQNQFDVKYDLGLKYKISENQKVTIEMCYFKAVLIKIYFFENTFGVLLYLRITFLILF
mgnify:CR=1 FL=1